VSSRVTLAVVLVVLGSIGLSAASAGTSANLPAVPATPTVAVTLSGSTWQGYPAPSGLPVLIGLGLASDPVDGGVVAFGGCPGSLCSGGTNATWFESEGRWTQLAPPHAPPPRSEVAMAWDPVDGYVLLFGGRGCLDPPGCTQSGFLNDTWAFKDGAWIPVVPSGRSPPAGDGSGLAFDPSDREMVLFGGSACATSCPTWTYVGGAWTELNLTTAPSPRAQPGLAEDDADGGALLFGGVSPSNVDLNDTWLFNAGAWHAEAAGASPPGRVDPVMAWDPDADAVVMAGGANSANSPPSVNGTWNDTWSFAHGAWGKWPGATTPTGILNAGLAEDPSTGVLVLLGGCEGGCPAVLPWGFGPQYAVTVAVTPGLCARVLLGAQNASVGQATPTVQNGSYALTIAACRGFQVANLTASSDLRLNETEQNLTAWVGVVVVEGAGTLTVNLTRAPSNSGPTGLEAISVLGLTFLELLLIGVAIAAVVGLAVALQLSGSKRRRRRPPPEAKPPAPGGF
jgi:hypothetical protein